MCDVITMAQLQAIYSFCSSKALCSAHLPRVPLPVVDLEWTPYLGNGPGGSTSVLQFASEGEVGGARMYFRIHARNGSISFQI